MIKKKKIFKYSGTFEEVYNLLLLLLIIIIINFPLINS